MTVPEYAAHRGCSDSYVRRLRREARLVLDEDGLIDVAKSDAMLDNSTDPLRGGNRSGKGDQELPRDDQAAAARVATGDVSLREAMRRERLARARLAELELGEESGDLIRKPAAARDVFTLARQAMERLQALPSLLRGRMAAEGDPAACEALLRAEVDKVCEEMRRAAAAMATVAPESAAAEGKVA